MAPLRPDRQLVGDVADAKAVLVGALAVHPAAELHPLVDARFDGELVALEDVDVVGQHETRGTVGALVEAQALGVSLVFFIVFFNAFQGVREVDRNLLANARILGASQRQLSTAVIIPSALTWIFASLHTSFSFALVGAVVGEYIGGLQGIGLLIQTAGANFNANGVFAAMVILAAVALLSEFLITLLERRLLRWRPNPVADVTI